MSYKDNKPKNVGDMSASFEDYLSAMGKIGGSPKPRKNQPTQQVASNLVRRPQFQQAQQHSVPQAKGFKSVMEGDWSQQAAEDFANYTRQQSKQIIYTWGMLMQAFGSKFAVHFGDEPDKLFMKFAVGLTNDAFERLKANLYERLDENQEWPPSFTRLTQLADSPTKEMMYQARKKLFHHPERDFNKLTRVERYIKKYKMNEVRMLSDKYFEQQFNRRFTVWFREVMFDDMDLVEAEEAKKLAGSELVPTKHDKRREKEVQSGKAFSSPIGERIKKIMEDKKSHVMIEDITEENE
ncbi:hypothetical protein [Vibrio breoganii]|uniref:hypothetical protein n=1 Tax=Vibrio breoganii TaxID=553239 RepID=UPI000C83F42E|nr:hypothetical protein [Vibrio breoganii]PMG90886.1 hypothetical protein BCU79_17510 [Vibrio breoganii]PMJ48006.1 hypothetical protein BCU21_04835 [Vibrio breoganii]PMK51140.1 hypothetical protein BCT97_18345 [Vibrio breoganii]PMM89734.1 hypothetical protein BCT44_16615 [Vibrio breoganii]PMO25445.1 hypothetical protein BCT14_16520 [Vibrio breoganii]